MAKDPLAQYESTQEAVNFANAIGQTGKANKLQKDLDRWDRKMERGKGRWAGVDVSGLDINDFQDTEDWAPGSADTAMKVLTRMKKRQLNKRGVEDTGRATAKYKQGLNKAAEGQYRFQAEEEYDPTLEALQDTATENVDKMAISAEDEAAIRSRLAAMLRTAKSENLNTVGAALGLGNMENSPAAAALASRAAQDYDSAITSGLRDTSLQVNQINRKQQSADIDLATRIANTRWNMFHGDTSSIGAMRGEIADMVQALYSRDLAIDWQRQALDDAQSESSLEKIGGYVDLANSLVNLGSKAYTGGQDMGIF